MCVLLFDVFKGYSASIKEFIFIYLMFLMDVLLQLNRQVNMERNVKHLLSRKTEVLRNSIFSGRTFEEMH